MKSFREKEEQSLKEISFDFLRILTLATLILIGYWLYNLIDNTVEYEYIINGKYDNQYYGQNVDDHTGIYFTDDFIKGEKIEVGDRVIAVFDEENTVDGLKYVKKWKSE